MPQDADRYLYFKVGILKDSFALEALWQDALKYHMIDQPAKLIAMRLTEYYELTKKGPMQLPAPIATPTTIPTTAAPPTAAPAVLTEREHKESTEAPTSGIPTTHPPASSPAAHSPIVRPIAHPPAVAALNAKHINTPADPASVAHRGNEASLAVSAEVDKNAEEAADYWSLL
jgi:hypothetical protein